MSIDVKQVEKGLDKVLSDLGREDLKGLFEEWKPRYSRRPKTAPLDQSVSLSVSLDEKSSLISSVDNLKKAGERISMSQYIRNKAMSSVDVERWREEALRALKDLEDIKATSKGFSERELELVALVDLETDSEKARDLEIELHQMRTNKTKIKASPLRRNTRLSGRVSFHELETIKWRAQRLHLNYSDYLRFLIFDLKPGSTGDQHLSYDARRRFYVSIIDVAENGFGKPPTIAECTQCVNYLEEIERLNQANSILAQSIRV